MVNDCCLGDIVIIIDAMDECADADRQLLISKLAELSTSTDRPGSLKLLLTSRHDSLMQDALIRSGQAVSIEQLAGDDPKGGGAIKLEIDAYIQSHISDFRGLRKARFGYDDNAHVRIRDHMLRVPNRTYLWVSLVFEELKACAGVPVADIQERLRTLPATVEDAYEDILLRSKDKTRAKKLLSLVLAAKENLTPTELSIALQVTERTQGFSELENLPEEALSSYLKDLCGSFIIFATAGHGLGGNSIKLFLIHETAREFLVKPAEDHRLCCPHPGWKHSIDFRDACCEYARSCVLLLLLTPDRELTRYTGRENFTELGVPDWIWSFYCEPGRLDLPIEAVSTAQAPIRNWRRCLVQANGSASSLIDHAVRLCRTRSNTGFLFEWLLRT